MEVIVEFVVGNMHIRVWSCFGIIQVLFEALKSNSSTVALILTSDRLYIRKIREVYVLKLIGEQGDRVFLILVGDEMARVLDLDQRKFFPPYNVDSILARGYWEDPTVEIERVIGFMQGVKVMEEHSRALDMDSNLVYVVNRDSDEILLTMILSNNRIRTSQYVDTALIDRLINTAEPKRRDICDEMEKWIELVPTSVAHGSSTYTVVDGAKYLSALVAEQPSCVVEFRGPRG